MTCINILKRCDCEMLEEAIVVINAKIRQGRESWQILHQYELDKVLANSAYLSAP